MRQCWPPASVHPATPDCGLTRCGIDVRKETVTANLLRRGVDNEVDLNEVRSFSTMTRRLLKLCECLEREGCTHSQSG
jgi:hypothetical protein